jgi:hypothetical protein
MVIIALIHHVQAGIAANLIRSDGSSGAFRFDYDFPSMM